MPAGAQTGEGNGNPLQCSCLENPRDRGAWWAAVYGVAESDTTEATQQQQLGPSAVVREQVPLASACRAQGRCHPEQVRSERAPGGGGQVGTEKSKQRGNRGAGSAGEGPAMHKGPARRQREKGLEWRTVT